MITPLFASIEIKSPDLNILQAFLTLTTQGNPNSRAITAPWLISPPISVINPPIIGKYGLQPISVE